MTIVNSQVPKSEPKSKAPMIIPLGESVNKVRII